MKSSFALDLGMPHLGRNNLSESSLFKAIGNDRWKMIEACGGIPTGQIRDDAGARLYATFFYLEVHFTPERPLAAHGENERMSFETDLLHSGQVYLDGRHRLVQEPDIWIRSSNVFIYQERGPSQLKMSIPANMSFADIPELPTPPDSLTLCRAARQNGSFFDREPDDVDLFAGVRECCYQLDPDRDMNGAGLVYFANFIAFLDRAEREAVAGIRCPIPPSVLDARSTYFRRIGYFGNAQASDALRILVRARMRALPSATHGRLIDIGLDYRVLRSSDEKEIVISSCRKVSPMVAGSPDEEWFENMTA